MLGKGFERRFLPSWNAILVAPVDDRRAAHPAQEDRLGHAQSVDDLFGAQFHGLIMGI